MTVGNIRNQGPVSQDQLNQLWSQINNEELSMMQLQQLKMQLDQLEQMAGGANPGALQQQQGMPGPSSSGCGGQGYANPVGSGQGGSTPLDQWLSAHPHDRQLLEMAVGGNITSTGNGKLSVQPFDSGQFNGGGQNNNVAATAQQMMGLMQRASDYLNGVQAGEAANGGQNPFNGAVLGGLANILNGGGGGGVGSGSGGGGLDGLGLTHQQFEQQLMDDLIDPADRQRKGNFQGGGNVGGSGGSGGGGTGGGTGGGGGGGGIDPGGGGNSGNYGPNFQSANVDNSGGSSGDPGGYQVGGNNGPVANGNDDVSNILNDGALTVEDKITLMIMAIMKKMDKQIEQMGNYINSLQQQQDAKGGAGGGGADGGAGGAGGAGGQQGGGSPSIDVETMKLKRLIDKRSQMFDMLRQIIDKYNETAKGIIDKIGQV